MTERKMTDGRLKARIKKVTLALYNIQLNNGKKIDSLGLNLGAAYLAAMHNAKLFTSEHGIIAWNPKVDIISESIVTQIVDEAYAKGQVYQQTYLAKQESLVNTQSEAVVTQPTAAVMIAPKIEEQAPDVDILTKLIQMNADALVRLVRLEQKIDLLNSQFGM
jgi:hypothetical protein